MKAWKFDVADHPDQNAPTLWQDVLSRLCLPASRLLPHPGRFDGRVTSLVTPLGIEIARVESSPQEISGRYIRQQDGIWLAQLLHGHGTLAGTDGQLPMQAGDVAYGPVATHSVLTLPVPMALLYVRLPRLALNARLLGPAPVRVGLLPRQSAMTHILASMLGGVANTLDDLTTAHLRPLEVAISEFLIGSVLGDYTSNPVRAASSVRLALFHRVCQTIEAELGDPELSLTKVAKQEGISPRNMQKLFEQADQSFSRYIRVRRLERCKSDLASPLQAHMSISEICFRWGFNDAAHFSRSFRDQYATTPRAWRNAEHAGLLERQSDNEAEQGKVGALPRTPPGTGVPGPL